jgi:hypothetical protein
MKNPLPYVAGTKPSYDPKLETKEFKFDGRDKRSTSGLPRIMTKSRMINIP